MKIIKEIKQWRDRKKPLLFIDKKKRATLNYVAP